MKKLDSGQALITLIVFVTVAITIIGASISVSIINTQSSSKFGDGEDAYVAAEAGAEEGILRLLRNQNYTGPINGFVVGNSGTVDITFTSPTTNDRIILATATNGAFKRKVQVSGTFNSSGVFVISDWREID